MLAPHSRRQNLLVSIEHLLGVADGWWAHPSHRGAHHEAAHRLWRVHAAQLAQCAHALRSHHTRPAPNPAVLHATKPHTRLIAALRHTAESLTAAFGEEAAADYRVDQPIPEDPHTLLAFAELAVVRMRAFPRQGHHALFGFPVHSESVADRLSDLTRPLHAALYSTSPPPHTHQTTLERAQQQYRAAAHALYSMFLACEEDSLAALVRPTLPRASGFTAPHPAADHTDDPSTADTLEN